jgi:hypothetical protein
MQTAVSAIHAAHSNQEIVDCSANEVPATARVASFDRAQVFAQPVQRIADQPDRAAGGLASTVEFPGWHAQACETAVAVEENPGLRALLGGSRHVSR